MRGPGGARRHPGWPDTTLAGADVTAPNGVGYRVLLMEERRAIRLPLKLVDDVLDEVLPFPFNAAVALIPRPPGWHQAIWDVKVLRLETAWRAQHIVHEEQTRGLAAAIDYATELAEAIQSGVSRRYW